MATRQLEDVKPTKRELTRKKVMQAAINSIDRHGFHASHTNRIAEEAGVSWGVLQYHFRDRDGLLQALVDDIFEDFLTTLANTEPGGDDLEQCLHQFIDTVWSLISKKSYRVCISILRNAGKDGASRFNGQKHLRQWARRMSDLWDDIMPDELAGTQHSETARHLLFAALRGLADDVNPGGKLKKSSWQAERAALSDAITYILRNPG